MNEFWEMLVDNIYELCIGLGLVLTTVFNRRKPTAEEIKAAKEKRTEKIRRKGQKATEKAQKLERKFNELNKEE